MPNPEENSVTFAREVKDFILLWNPFPADLEKIIKVCLETSKFTQVIKHEKSTEENADGMVWSLNTPKTTELINDVVVRRKLSKRASLKNLQTAQFLVTNTRRKGRKQIYPLSSWLCISRNVKQNFKVYETVNESH